MGKRHKRPRTINNDSRKRVCLDQCHGHGHGVVPVIMVQQELQADAIRGINIQECAKKEQKNETTSQNSSKDAPAGRSNENSNPSKKSSNKNGNASGSKKSNGGGSAPAAQTQTPNNQNADDNDKMDITVNTNDAGHGVLTVNFREHFEINNERRPDLEVENENENDNQPTFDPKSLWENDAPNGVTVYDTGSWEFSPFPQLLNDFQPAPYTGAEEHRQAGLNFAAVQYTLGGFRFNMRQCGPQGGNNRIPLLGRAVTGGTITICVDTDQFDPDSFKHQLVEFKGSFLTVFGGDINEKRTIVVMMLSPTLRSLEEIQVVDDDIFRVTIPVKEINLAELLAHVNEGEDRENTPNDYSDSFT